MINNNSVIVIFLIFSLSCFAIPSVYRLCGPDIRDVQYLHFANSIKSLRGFD